MAIYIAVLRQFVGCNVVIAFGPSVLSTVVPSLKTVIPIIINLLLVIDIFPMVFLIRQFGRKTIMQGGTLVCALAVGLIAAGFFVK